MNEKAMEKAIKIKCETEDYVEAVIDSSSILLKLNGLRKKDEFCDVTIIVNDEKFRAHRIVLSALSPFFEVLLNKHFAESKKEEIEIREVDPYIIEIIFDFAYTTRLKFTRSTALELLKAADRFQISEVKNEVCKYLESHIDLFNSVEIFCVSSMLHCIDLKRESKNFILRNFSELYENSCFDPLSMELLTDITCDDNLCVQEEDTVFEAVSEWLGEHPDVSQENSVALLKTVRFANLSPNFLVNVVDCHPVCKSSEELQLLIKKVLAFRMDSNMSNPPWTEKHRKIIFDQFGLAIAESQKWFVADETNIWCYNPWLQKMEYKLPPLCQIKTKPALVVHGHNLYAIGSTVIHTTTSDPYRNRNSHSQPSQHLGLEKYDLRQLSDVINGIQTNWMSLGLVPNSVNSSNATYVVAALNNKLYMKVNGREHLDIYEISMNQWITSTNMNGMTMGEGIGICSMLDYIYLVGGGKRYNTKTLTWESTAPLPESVTYPGVSVKDGKIWVRKDKDLALVYDHYTNFWSSQPLHNTDSWPLTFPN